MIRFIPSGGLGNQMFQYAAARALSLKLSTSLSADLYKIYKKSRATFRPYQLSVFDLRLETYTSLVDKIVIKGFDFLKSNKLGIHLLKKKGYFTDKDSQTYDEAFHSLSDGTILFGYFQNEQYFSTYQDIIRKDFTFSSRLDNQNLQVLQAMQNENSVSIHIRRGDYKNNQTNLFVQPTEYYAEAMRWMEAKLNDPIYFIFSDEIDWAKEHLPIPKNKSTFIDWNIGENAYLDMQLMSNCKHNIIANSSFSWWGAWLNPNTEKIVVAPSKWYKNRKAENYPEGFIPDSWTIL